MAKQLTFLSPPVIFESSVVPAAALAVLDPIAGMFNDPTPTLKTVISGRFLATVVVVTFLIEADPCSEGREKRGTEGFSLALTSWSTCFA